MLKVNFFLQLLVFMIIKKISNHNIFFPLFLQTKIRKCGYSAKKFNSPQNIHFPSIVYITPSNRHTGPMRVDFVLQKN